MDFAKWTSGNKQLDGFIRDAQLKAVNARSVLEWVEYTEFTNVKHLANGGNSSVYVITLVGFLDVYIRIDINLLLTFKY